ncbi:MAG: hypothetical protein JNL01_06930 [Bdellovibrionales bacterium]|nr:hypothetical protein [Bdellovibrionales bacterium]
MILHLVVATLLGTSGVFAKTKTEEPVPKVDPSEVTMAWVTEKGIYAFPWAYEVAWNWAEETRATPFEHPRLEIEIALPKEALSVTFKNDDGIFTAAQGQKLKTWIDRRRVQWDVEVKTEKGTTYATARIEIKAKHSQILLHSVCLGHGIRVLAPQGIKRPLFIGLTCEQPTPETLHIYVAKPSDHKFKEISSPIAEVTEESDRNFLWSIPVREITKRKLGTIGLLEEGAEYPTLYDLTYGQPMYRDRPLPWNISAALGASFTEYRDPTNGVSWGSVIGRLAGATLIGDRTLLRGSMEGQMVGLGIVGDLPVARTWRFSSGLTWLLGSQARNYTIRFGLGLAGAGILVPMVGEIRPYGFTRRLGPEFSLSGQWIRAAAPPIEWRLELATYPDDIIGFSLVQREINVAFFIPFTWREWGDRFVPWSWWVQLGSLNIAEPLTGTAARVITATNLTAGLQIEY